MQIDEKLPKDRRILLAAEKVFSKHGFERATLDEIIALADVGKGTVYKYFGNKERLFYKLAAEKNEPFVELLKTAAAKGTTIEEKLFAYFVEMVRFYTENSSLWQIICFEMLGASHGCMVKIIDDEPTVVPRYAAEPDEDLKEQILRYHNLLSSEFIILKELIDNGVEAGVLKAGNSRITTRHLFFGVAMGIFNPHEVDGMDNETAAKIIVDRFLHGEMI